MAGESDRLDQQSVDEQVAAPRSAPTSQPKTVSPPSSATSLPGGGPDQAGPHSGPQGTSAALQNGAAPATNASQIMDDIQLLLEQTEHALASVDKPVDQKIPGVASFEFKEFIGTPASTEQATLELIRDVELDVKIELGRTYMYVDELLKLRRGSVVTLDKLAGDPVDVYVNGRLVARGEVLVLNDNFCVRVAELVAGDGRTMSGP